MSGKIAVNASSSGMKDEWAVVPGICSIRRNKILYVCRRDARLGWVCETVVSENRDFMRRGGAYMEQIRSGTRLSITMFEFPPDYVCPECGDTRPHLFECGQCQSINCFGGVTAFTYGLFLQCRCGGCGVEYDGICSKLQSCEATRPESVGRPAGLSRGTAAGVLSSPQKIAVSLPKKGLKGLLP
jgi:hypothetical protein